MKRWLALLILALPSTGCAMMEEIIFDEGPPTHFHATAEPPMGTCNSNGIRNVSASQTAEPELLRR